MLPPATISDHLLTSASAEKSMPAMIQIKTLISTLEA